MYLVKETSYNIKGTLNIRILSVAINGLSPNNVRWCFYFSATNCNARSKKMIRIKEKIKRNQQSFGGVGMNETLILAILSSSFITTILNFVLNRIDKKSNINKALMCLLGYELKNECHRLIKAKQVELDDLEQLQELNTLYHQMGGNGYVKTLMNRVEHLEVKHND